MTAQPFTQPRDSAARLVNEGISHYNARRYSIALRFFRKAARASRPAQKNAFGVAECLLSLARLSLEAGDPARAARRVADVLRRDPANAEALDLRARMAEIPQAVDVPRNAQDLLRARIEKALSARRWSAAEPLLQKRLRSAPSDLEARRGLCWVWHNQSERLMDGGTWSQVLALQRRIVKLTGPGERDESLRSMRFQSLVRLGRFTAAFKEAEAALDAGISVRDARSFAQPWDAEHLRRYASRHARTLELMAKQDRFVPWPEFLLGELRNRPENTSLHRSSRYGWMNYALGRRQLLTGGRYPLAYAALRRCLRYEPRDWRAHAFLAESWICRKKPGAAMAEFRHALSLASEEERSQVLAWRGELRLWIGDYAAALKDLDEAGRLGGLGAEFAFCWRGAVKMKLGRSEEALADLDRALELRPRDHEASVWRGELHRERGRYEDALKDLNREPVGTWAKVNRALIRGDLGDVRGMRADFDSLPLSMFAGLRRRGFTPGAELDAAQMTRCLNDALRRAKGFRREEYRQTVWIDRRT